MGAKSTPYILTLTHENTAFLNRGVAINLTCKYGLEMRGTLKYHYKSAAAFEHRFVLHRQ